MTILDSTLANAEAAFSSIITLADLPSDSTFVFRIVSEIKMGWEIWITEPASPGVPEAKKLYTFRDTEKSRALRLKRIPEDKPYPFLFFCAYIPNKKVLQFLKIKPKVVFQGIIDTHRRYHPEDIFEKAVCTVHKNMLNGKPNYTFNLASTLDVNTGIPTVSKTPMPEECLKLLEVFKFDMDKVYENEDPFICG